MTAHIDSISIHARTPDKGGRVKEHFAIVRVEDNMDSTHQMSAKVDAASARAAFDAAMAKGEALCRRMDRASANERAFQDQQDGGGQ